jgi:hypothetical protein
MKMFTKGIVNIGSRVSPLLLVILVVSLNIYWVLTLEALDAHFVELSGSSLIDLQLQRSVTGGAAFTPEMALAEINTYSVESKSFYWTFFILDNAMPPLVFGSFAFLWVFLLRIRPDRLSTVLLRSPLLLVPFGVGLVDWLENLAFVTAIHAAPDTALSVLNIGFALNTVKAIFVTVTFPLTFVLVMYTLVRLIRSTARLHSNTVKA